MDEIELVQGGNIVKAIIEGAKKIIDTAGRIYTLNEMAEDADDVMQAIEDNAPYGSTYDFEGCSNQCPW